MNNLFDKVPFIDTEVWRVKKDSPLHKEANLFIHTTWGTLRNGQAPPIFPGPQPTSIARRHLPLLKQNQYFVCEKTDGTRYGLICFMFEGKKMCLLVNRALDMYILSMNMPRSAYKGTFLDGELVKLNDGTWNFVVYDGVMISGDNIGGLILQCRLDICCKFTLGILRTSKDLVKHIYVKNFWKLEDLEKLMTHDFKYETDGLVFTPNNEPIRVGTHDTLFKWKPRDKNTIDFQVKGKRLFIQEKGLLVYECDIDQEYPEDTIVECKYIIHLRKWVPIGVRTDKHHPNNRRTFYKTLENIREDIQINEFSR
tara:strand:- start:556 stop:1488 length:933 start_codon:yes stop_codon:yes gene_type:complete